MCPGDAGDSAADSAPGRTVVTGSALGVPGHSFSRWGQNDCAGYFSEGKHRVMFPVYVSVNTFL